MALQHKIDGVSVNAHIRIPANGKQGVAGWPNIAWYCEPGIAGITVDDPEGELDLVGWHVYTAEETSCTSQPRIFGGWIIGRTIRRGDYRHGAAREWDCDIIDINALFSLETFRSTAASVRPAETDVERVQACIASHAMAGTPIADNGRLNTSGALNLAASNFVAQYPVDMLNNAAGQCAKNVYAYWDPDAEEISIHYDLVGVGPAASISFSNIIADVDDDTVFFPQIDGEMTIDPQGEYTGVLLMSAAGNFYGRSDTLIDDLSPTEFSPVNFLRDLVVNSDRVSKVATAETYLEKLLGIHDHEESTLKFSAILPAAKVNLAMAGDAVNLTFTHIPGFETGADVIITRRSVAQVEGRSDRYLVGYECTNDASGSVGAGGGPVGGIVVPPRPTGSHWWEGDFVTNGDSYNYSGNTRDGFEPGTEYNFSISVIEQPGLGTYASSVCPQTNLADTGLNSPDLGIDSPPEFATVSGNMEVHTHSPGGDTEVFTGTILTGPGVDPMDVFDMRCTTADDDHSGTHVTRVIFWFDPVDPTTPTDPPVAPLPGQWVYGETPTPPADAATTVFNTLAPYVVGSLTVFVDNQNETAAVDESDPESGEFTLAFAPVTSERLTVNYQAAT